MWLRLVIGGGLFALGYYLGREVERTKPVREELARARGSTDGERSRPAADQDPADQG
jgi:hypothetical protein